MEPFENNEINDWEDEAQSLPEEPAIQPEPEPAPTAYHGAGTGRRESPYANSPYVMNQPREEYRYQPHTEPPQKPKKAKKSRKPIWKPLLAGLLVVALVAVQIRMHHNVVVILRQVLLFHLKRLQKVALVQLIQCVLKLAMSVRVTVVKAAIPQKLVLNVTVVVRLQ